MRRVCSVLLMCVLAAVLAQAASSRPRLVFVKVTHPPVHKHKAHKAGKHRAPKRRHHSV